ncbi:MAG: DMT family transporter [Alicyclobacillus mali]|uniref:EamA family transporter n=1 Tax=Alicyclobacillus mali (ex Roth et al. 2021) TaxID=1123961 RepID=UPI0023F41557|nr:DMT family transporter [Alicyclobacillus mali (ex Roth et al. 2021)]MCL6488246.1 DMT family transporter [Alicyclobacillus mali (ex Roth et al. 2021)]
MYAIMMLCAAAMYGLVSPVLRIAYAAGLDPATATDAQYAIAAVCLWLVAMVRHRGKRIDRCQWMLILLIGLMNALFCYTYYRALAVLPASLAIVFMFQFVWMATLIDAVWHRRWPGPAKWLGLLFILGGTVLAVGATGAAWKDVPVGAALLGLGAALAYAINLTVSAQNDPAVSPELRSALVITVAGIAVLSVFPPGAFVHHLAARPPITLFWGFWIALLSQVLPTLFALIAIPRIGGRMAAVLGTLELPVAVVGAWLMNGDHVSPLRWLGVLLILAGMVISEAMSREKGPAAEAASPLQTRMRWRRKRAVRWREVPRR